MNAPFSTISKLNRRSVFSIGLVLSSAIAGAFFARPSCVMAANPPAAADAQQPYYGVLNEDNVLIRSGPSDVYYATGKLNKGAKVTVVAVRDTWLKIIPPEGSYCYVARAYVEKRGDGTVGRVVKAEINVRAGSMLNGLKTTVLTTLAEGDDVKIVGEQEEYYKISPPPGAYLYITKNSVDAAPLVAGQQPIAPMVKSPDPIPSAPIPAVVQPPVIAAAQAPVAPVPAIPPAPVARVALATPATPVAPMAPPNIQPPPTLVSQTAVVPATQPVVAVSPLPPATQPIALVPATQPAEPTADAKFDALESDFLAATKLPLDQQPVDKLLGEYTKVVADPKLSVSMQQVGAMRVATLKMRSEARKDYIDAAKMQADARSRQQALRAEHEELAQKAKDQQTTFYTAIGTLRVSSLQQGGTPLYRLTDPGTGRTLVYIKSGDPKYAKLLNQFIGVKGDITEDSNMNLKEISPTAVDAVDINKVNNTVSATVIPPSLLTKNTTASAGN